MDLRQVNQIRESLKALIGDDDEAMRDTLEGEIDLPALFARIVKAERDDAAMVEGLEDYADSLLTRALRIKTRMENRRAVMLQALELVDQTRVETAFGTVYRSKVAPKAIISDESALPTDLFKPQPPKLDRMALTRRLKAGEKIEGATLSNGGYTVGIKTV